MKYFQLFLVAVAVVAVSGRPGGDESPGDSGDNTENGDDDSLIVKVWNYITTVIVNNIYPSDDSLELTLMTENDNGSAEAVDSQLILGLAVADSAFKAYLFPLITGNPADILANTAAQFQYLNNSCTAAAANSGNSSEENSSDDDSDVEADVDWSIDEKTVVGEGSDAVTVEEWSESGSFSVELTASGQVVSSSSSSESNSNSSESNSFEWEEYSNTTADPNTEESSTPKVINVYLNVEYFVTYDESSSEEPLEVDVVLTDSGETVLTVYVPTVVNEDSDEVMMPVDVPSQLVVGFGAADPDFAKFINNLFSGTADRIREKTANAAAQIQACNNSTASA